MAAKPDRTLRSASRRPRGTSGTATEKKGRRIILVSNRLPISVRVERGELVVAASPGGLATGLSGYHARGESLWIGWPGESWRLTAGQQESLRKRLADMRAIPIEISAAEIQRYYDGFSNGVLWPLLHYHPDRLPNRIEGWDTYQRINQRFADAVVKAYRPGDLIWVHDYQLMLVPAMIRRQLPDAPIGFFLHVPFPSAEVFRILPWRRQLLEGMLGSTLIGFHTVSYVLHFMTSAANVLGCETRPGRISLAGHTVRVATFPMGIDVAQYEGLARTPAVMEETERLRTSTGDAALIVAVDRLDYTKGIPRRLLAFERLLEKYPRLRGRVRLVQVASPSRSSVNEYREFRRTVDEMVGRINGRFSSPGYDPIHYISQNLTSDHLVAFYRAANVALVTPLRDGMNLVAKEFVASRIDGDGVLVLSEFAGAAAELTDALLVNPYDLDSVAATIRAALEMPEAERRARMQGMRERVAAHNVRLWARQFISALANESRRQSRHENLELAQADRPVDVVAAALADGKRSLTLLLDYDGTLVGLRPSPAEASPDSEILRILATLALLPGAEVDVVSGRRRADLQLWLGNLPIGLHAEHGLWSRDARQDKWVNRDVGTAWLGPARQMMAARVAEVPGSMLEEKDASVAWHYRNVPAVVGTREAAALERELTDALAGTSAAVVRGHAVVEVRDSGINKGLVVKALIANAPRSRLLIMGDDTTDEDMFAAAPADAVTVHVGSGSSSAKMRLLGPDQVRKVLVELAERLGGHLASPGSGEEPGSAEAASEATAVESAPADPVTAEKSAPRHLVG